MAGKDGNPPEDSKFILTSLNLPQPQEGKVDAGNLIRTVLADKSALDMLKSAIKVDSKHEHSAKADQGPATQRAIKAHQSIDPEVTVIEHNPPKKPRWDVAKPGTSSTADDNDHEEVTDTEAYASDDITSAARWSASEELSSYLELVARKPLTNFKRKTVSGISQA